MNNKNMEMFQPPPFYPPLINRPLYLEFNPEYDRLLEINQNLREQMRTSCFYVDLKERGKDEFNLSIERYSNVTAKQKQSELNQWQPDWDRLPRELRLAYENKISKTKRRSNLTPNLKVKRKTRKATNLLKLTDLVEENNENEEEDEEDEEDEEAKKEKKSTEKDGDEDEEEREENEEEEDLEEDNDYIENYFDNGEGYGDDDYGGDEEEVTI